MIREKKSKVGRHYWDACIFIHLIQGNDPDNSGALRSLNDKAKRGEIVVLTSTLTLAEVVRPRHCDAKNLLSSDKRVVADSFKHEHIILQDVTQHVAARAREIQWNINGIKPIDALHLATAEVMKADFFDTYDENSIISKVEAVADFNWLHDFKIGFPVDPQTEFTFPDDEESNKKTKD